MFGPRIWFDEVERIGKQRCTPSGYQLQGVGEAIEGVGCLCLLVLLGFLVWKWFAGPFSWITLWWLMAPFALNVFGKILVDYSWTLAERKQFKYDYERRISSWVEGDQSRSFTYEDYQHEEAAKGK
jgi:hypothetical protein